MTESNRLKEILLCLCAWYPDNHRLLPWRSSTDPYAVWVSEIMLQQTRVQTVIPYYERFMRALPTVSALAEVPEDQLMKLWEGLGYYTRARNLQRAARQICTEYGGLIPSDRESLLTLPGIGSYTAGAIASISGGQCCPAVDGNVMRVLSRLFAREWDVNAQKNKKQAERELQAVMPKEAPGVCNQALMELGATRCLPNGVPDCKSCPVCALCKAYGQGRALDYPVRQPKKHRPTERRVVVLLWKDGRLALRKRPQTGLLAGMWEFPNFPEGADAEQELGVRLSAPVRLRCAKHVFTHREWHMMGLEAKTTEGGMFIWVTPEELEEAIALPSAFRVFREIALQDHDRLTKGGARE